MNHFRANALGILLAAFAALTLAVTGFVAFRFYLPAARRGAVPIWPVFLWALGIIGVVNTAVEIVRVHGRFPFVIGTVSCAAVFIGFVTMGANYKKSDRRV